MFDLILLEVFALAAGAALYLVSSSEKEAAAKTRLFSLGKIPSSSAQAAPEAVSLRERLLAPWLRELGKSLAMLTPDGLKRDLQKRLSLAGNPAALEGYILGQAAISLGLGLAGYSLGGNGRLLLTPVLFVLGLRLPAFWLSKKITQRRETIGKALPAAIDLLAVSVEAGLGFDGSMQQVAEKMPGPLTDEINVYLKEVRLGKPRDEALRTLADRIDLPEMRSFVAAVLQADSLGVSIAKVLFLQAEAIRTARRQQAQEKAMKIPVKLLFPLVFFIFPSLFVVLLGPLILHMSNLFGHH